MSDWLKEQAEYAGKIIATWPEWKKGLLGRFSQPMSETPRPFVDNHSVLCSGDHSKPIGEPGCCCLRMLNDSQQWHPVMPFWIDTDAYSPRDRDMFVCGVEFQMVYQAIREKRDWDQCIHTENESRVRMMCGKLGVPVQMKRVDDTWTHCWIPASTTT